MQHRLQILAWGGSPIRECLSSPGIAQDDRILINKWGEFLTDPQYESDWIKGAEKGQVWIETASSSGQHRLLLRVVPESLPGARRVWHYFAYQFSFNSPTTPADWARILKLLTSRFPTLPETDEIAIDLPETSATPSLLSSIRHQLGREFTGDYGTALDLLFQAVASSSWNDLADMTIACNPPRSDGRFGALIRTGDYWSKPPMLVPFSADPTLKEVPSHHSLEFRWKQTKVVLDRIVQTVMRNGPLVLSYGVIGILCFQCGRQKGYQEGYARAEKDRRALAEKDKGWWPDLGKFLRPPCYGNSSSHQQSQKEPRRNNSPPPRSTDHPPASKP